jgi:hypothetical protein
VDLSQCSGTSDQFASSSLVSLALRLMHIPSLS